MADIILKNAKGTPQLYSGVTKINVPTSDGGIATYSEGGGIEEVTELPEATAENVGKIYKLSNKISSLGEITEIRVPQALLEEWKTATNWSAYADKMVGV